MDPKTTSNDRMSVDEETDTYEIGREIWITASAESEAEGR